MSGEIYKALTTINKEVGVIKKDQRNQQQGFNYRGIDDIMNELHSLFAKNEVLIFPNVLNVESTERQNKSGGTLFCVKAKIRFDFIHSSGEGASCTLVGEAMDSGDKAVTKATSIALKYALLQMFLIPTTEDKDPDGTTHEVRPVKKAEPVIQTPPESVPDTSLELENAMEMINRATTEATLMDIYKTFTTLRKEKAFITALSQKKTEIKRMMI